MKGEFDKALAQIDKSLSTKNESNLFPFAYWLKILIYTEKKTEKNLTSLLKKQKDI